MIKIIVAYNKHRVIGVDGDLPWRIKEDLQHFKETTTGHVCVMGRKTWESIPPKFRPLSDRVSLILTRDSEKYLEDNPELEDMSGVHVCSDVDSAVKLSKFAYPEKELFVTGGGEIYNQFLEKGIVDKVIASEIKGYEDVDDGVKFPIFPAAHWDGFLRDEFEEFSIWVFSKLS